MRKRPESGDESIRTWRVKIVWVWRQPFFQYTFRHRIILADVLNALNANTDNGERDSRSPPWHMDRGTPLKPLLNRRCLKIFPSCKRVIEVIELALLEIGAVLEASLDLTRDSDTAEPTPTFPHPKAVARLAVGAERQHPFTEVSERRSADLRVDPGT